LSLTQNVIVLIFIFSNNKVNNKKIIYDVGANNGDDIEYYLKKSDLVIAIEANPKLCEIIQDRFKTEIENKKLIVENCVVTILDEETEVPFYINRNNHVLSQYPKPLNIDEFDEISLPAKNIINIVNKYGEPFYIKIDVEHYDQKILKKLLENKIIPTYISAEAHNVEIFPSLVVLGNYNSFKIVDGNSVSKKYKDHKIQTLNGIEEYSFPHHSAGPFGNDIHGPWMTAHNFFHILGIIGLGWKDIHASKVDASDPNYRPPPQVNISVKL